jgi:hypothetical protein
MRIRVEMIETTLSAGCALATNRLRGIQKGLVWLVGGTLLYMVYMRLI